MPWADRVSRCVGLLAVVKDRGRYVPSSYLKEEEDDDGAREEEEVDEEPRCLVSLWCSPSLTLWSLGHDLLIGAQAQHLARAYPTRRLLGL